jgi:hypothetical protein
MKIRISKTLKLWVDVACEQRMRGAAGKSKGLLSPRSCTNMKKPVTRCGTWTGTAGSRGKPRQA